MRGGKRALVAGVVACGERAGVGAALQSALSAVLKLRSR